MTTTRLAMLNGIVFYGFWIAILYAGADHPPPLGFLAVVFPVAACAMVVYHRVPTYVQWQRMRRPGRRLRVLGEGLVAGLIVALLPLFLAGSVEPSTPLPTWGQRAVWFAVVGTVGMLNAAGLWLVNALLLRFISLRHR